MPTIVLMGAGATSEMGYPLLSEISIYEEIEKLPPLSRVIPELDYHSLDTLKPLIAKMDTYLRAHHEQAGVEAVIDRCLRYRQIVGETADDDVLRDVFFRVQSPRNRAGALQRKAGALHVLLHKVLLQVYGTEPAETHSRVLAVKKLLTLLEKLRRQSSPQELCVYTTNYDTAWEHMQRWTDRNFRFIDRTSQGDKASQKTALGIQRLHGCVRYCTSHTGCVYVPDDAIDWDMLEFKIETESARRRAGFFKPSLAQLMVIKVGGCDPDLECEPFRRAFDRFERNLNIEGAVCLAIGFSFRDRGVSHRIFDALYRGRVHRLVCVDPSISTEDVVRRLLTAGGYPANADGGRLAAIRIRIHVDNSTVAGMNVEQVVEQLNTGV